ncbi:hypothetical protein H6P81_018422 [Aristolochia fimbriata]|uniref:Amino acid transporter transmembrane domain-containing protein n=1 Tax=Aristolochia fimbriata TaxID=158543 RepID=A0AAV7E1B4_ARIFI|nr:hypothetical protein H6P81_018422 [Aristolochia fimbriata]
MVFSTDASSSSYSLPTESTPLLTRSHLSSQPKTFANVFIAVVGAGVLGLPYTFKRTGWLFGVLTVFFVALLTYHCMMLLVRTRRKLDALGFTKIASFGDLGDVVCGPLGKFAVDVMIVLSQAGFCVSYLIFIANTVANLLGQSPGSRIFLGFKPKTVYIWGIFPFQLGLNSIPTLTHLAPLSIFADVVDLGAMGVVMVEDVMIYLRNTPSLELFGGLSVVLYGLGVAVYAFEGIGMVLPLESETADKDKFGKTLGLSMGFIALMYGTFGVLGYMAFGQETNDIITTNFGKGLVSGLVQIGLCINLFFTFPLMMNPVYEVAERRLSKGRYTLWLRWVIVLFVSLVALLVPNFADFLSLVGSSVCIILGFVLPALFHLIVFKGEMDWKRRALDGVIVVVGVLLGVSGTFSSLVEIFSVKV